VQFGMNIETFLRIETERNVGLERGVTTRGTSVFRLGWLAEYLCKELTRNSNLLTVAGDATARSFTSNWKQMKMGICQKQEFIARIETLKGEVRCNRL
jgi:hypothetical protein